MDNIVKMAIAFVIGAGVLQILTALTGEFQEFVNQFSNIMF